MNKNISREWQEIPRLGLIPFNWCAVELGAIGEFKNGINKDKDDFGYGSKIVSLMDVFGKTEVRDFDYGLVNVSPKEIEAYGLIKGDILFVRSSVKPKGVGLTAVVVEDIPDTVFSGFIIRFRHNGSLDVNFSKHCFDEEGFRRRLLTKSTISANTNVNQQTLKRLILPLPPLAEQRRIAEILGAWDEAISLTQRLIAAKQQRKKGLMQQLLTGKVRLPGFAEVWNETPLGKVFKNRREQRFNDLPLLAVTANEGIVYRDTLDRRDTSNEDKSNYLRVCPGDIAYNTMRMWQGRSGVSTLEGIVSPAYTVLIPTKVVDVNFMGYLFQHPPIIYLFWRYSQGLVSDTWSLKYNVLAKIKIWIPSLDEQRAIAAVLQTADEEIELWQRKLAALRRQKKGLMQKLLTGQVRVKTLP